LTSLAPSLTPDRRRVHVVSFDVDVVTEGEAVRAIVERAQARVGGYVCAANVHMVMEAHDDPAFAEVVSRAFLVVPDGMPLVWAQRLMGVASAQRVRGPDLTLAVAKEAARRGVSVALFGSTLEVSERFAQALVRQAPGLQVAANISPPFGPSIDDPEYIAQIRDSGAGVVFVGLGCPKQEKWMARHAASLPAVLLGVGAAFDFHAGTLKEAPQWLGNLGLEWLFRLASEPRRLWRRYLRHNPRFVVALAAQLLSSRTRAIRSG